MAAIPHETLLALLGRGAAPGAALVWDGARWKATAIVGGAIVDDDEPASAPTGLFWYDTDASC